MVNPKNIFLADDDCDDVDFFTDALNEISQECNLFVACDGHELITKLEGTDIPPDIIFLDVNMPRMNGIDALSTIRNKTAYSTVPVVIYSTSADEAFIKKAYEAGANYYFTKPVDFQKLKDRINNFLTIDWSTSSRLPYDKFALV